MMKVACRMWSVLLCTLCACGGSDDHTKEIGVADIMMLQPSLGIGAYQPELNVQLSYPSGVNLGTCIELSNDVHITVNGTAMNVDDAGGVNAESDEIECEDPVLSLAEAPVSDATTLVFTDSSGTISCSLGSMLARRTLTLGSTTVARGSDVMMTWSPASDTNLYDTLAYVLPAGGSPQDRVNLDTVVAGGMITATVPSTLATGTYDLRAAVSDNAVRLSQLDCGLPAETYFRVDRGQQVTVQ